MSDTALGPQWWLAADGKWHPPELRPPSALHLVAPIIADTDATVARETELPYETEASVPSDTDDAVAFEAAPDAEETVGGEPASLIDTEPEPVEPIVAAVEEVATDDVVAIDEDEFDDTEFSLGDIAVIDGTPDAPAMEEQAPVEPVVDPVRSASSTPISPVLPGSTSESTSRDPGLPPEIQRAMSASIARRPGGHTRSPAAHRSRLLGERTQRPCRRASRTHAGSGRAAGSRGVPGRVRVGRGPDIH